MLIFLAPAVSCAQKYEGKCEGEGCTILALLASLPGPSEAWPGCDRFIIGSSSGLSSLARVLLVFGYETTGDFILDSEALAMRFHCWIGLVAIESWERDSLFK